MAIDEQRRDEAQRPGPDRRSRGRLTRLGIGRFRHVKPGTELRFDDGMNVLLGRNGTGKTTLLELIVAVVVGDLRAYQHEAFQLEFDMTLADERVSVWVCNDHQGSSGFTALLDEGDQGSSWRYRIRLDRHDGSTHTIDVVNGTVREYIGPGSTTPPPTEARLFVADFYVKCIKLALGIESLDFTGLTWPHRLIANNCLRLDEGLDLFRSMTEGSALPRLARPLESTLFSGLPRGNPQQGVRQLLEMVSFYVPAPLLGCLLDYGDEAHQRTELGVTSEQWDLLRAFEQLIGVADARVTMQLVARKNAEGADGSAGMASSFGRPVFRFTTRRGTTFTHDRLSYGEKRLLAFLYHAAANSSILVADELVNGLHHGWIQTCLDAIQGQAFLTSQNPLLLDHMPFSSAEEVQRRFVLCGRDEDGTWTWQNMKPDDAEAFLRAYEVGIQHVSEILETSGLW